jgi:hypothetical protein
LRAHSWGLGPILGSNNIWPFHTPSNFGKCFEILKVHTIVVWGLWSPSNIPSLPTCAWLADLSKLSYDGNTDPVSLPCL